MSTILAGLAARHLANPHARRGAAYGPAQAAVLNRAAFEAARDEISRWPAYRPTPLIDLDGLAKALGLGGIRYKDESKRFGLGAFKATGGAYAVFRCLQAAVESARGVRPDAASLAAGRYADVTRDLTVACASAGNHGRAVAFGARTFGCRAVIHLPRTIPAERADSIEALRAEVVRLDLSYDETVAEAARAAEERGWQVISDTAYAGYMAIPAQIMQGYAVMVDEALTQWPGGGRPSHAVIQCGVGGLAGAVCGHLWETFGPKRPYFASVEPEAADCFYQSVLAGRPAAASGDLNTRLTGLAAAELSLQAWPILKEGADAAVLIPEPAAVETMRLLARPPFGDPPLVAGASGSAGLAGLILMAQDPALATAAGLGPDSDVLVIGSEGATEPGVWRELTGFDAETVAA